MTGFSRETQELLKLARAKTGATQPLFKRSFVDPATVAGGGGDPAAAGGDPAAMGGDPAAMGGAPPPVDPNIEALMAKVTALEQQLAGGGGGGAAAGGAGAGVVKPKVDVNVTMLQILKMTAKICEAMGITIPPSDMVPTAQDTTQLSNMSQTGNFSGLTQGSAIPPIEPIQPAMPAAQGEGGGGGQKQSRAYEPDGHAWGLGNTAEGQHNLSAKAKALARVRGR